MCDTSDRTVTSYICPSTPDHSFGFYYIYNKESTTHLDNVTERKNQSDKFAFERWGS